MKKHIEWLEEEPLRMRKYLALMTSYIWVICVIVSYGLKIAGYDTLSILALVSAQFATVIGFYMVSNAKSDKD